MVVADYGEVRCDHDAETVVNGYPAAVDQKKSFQVKFEAAGAQACLELLEHSGSVFPAICLRNSWRGLEIVFGGPWPPYNPDLLSRVAGTPLHGPEDATGRKLRA